MKFNNQINSPTNSLGWTSFVTTVTASTPPTYGSGSSIISYYLRNGNILFLTLSITVVISGSSNGSGNYLFNLPLGFSMNTSIVSFPNSYFALGSANAYAQTNSDYGWGVALAYDTTHYILLLRAKSNGATQFVSSSFFQVTGGCNLGVDLLIPIV